MPGSSITPAKQRLLDLLKRLGPTGVGELAGRLDLTDVAVRQHLLALEERGLVEAAPRPPSGRGRPSSSWSLTELAGELFPDHHADLTVSLIQATRQAIGDEGLEKVIAARARAQLREYRRALPGPGAPLKKRVDALARQRTAEGYMAEVRRDGAAFLLIEHHCPICDAAKQCQRLCTAELDVFRRYLGRDVRIERVSHLLADGDRCAYRVEPRRPA